MRRIIYFSKDDLAFHDMLNKIDTFFKEKRKEDLRPEQSKTCHQSQHLQRRTGGGIQGYPHGKIRRSHADPQGRGS